MKAIILASSLGTRISEKAVSRPKPILCHIMKIYFRCGINNFVIYCGYKGYVIKEYFANYFLYLAYLPFNLKIQYGLHKQFAEPWQAPLV